MPTIDSMAQISKYQTRISSQGRVVLPSAIRLALGLHTGDTLNVSVDAEGVVRMISARALAERLWAANRIPSTPAGTAATEVRALRDADSALRAMKLEAISERRSAVTRTEAELTSELLEDLGLDVKA